MKTKYRDRLALISTCLACGGVGMEIIMCLFIGFGFHTVIGKEALYTALVLQALNLAVGKSRERRFLKSHAAPVTSKKMSRLRLVFTCVWCAAIALLLFSLLLAICGTYLGSFWVKIPCTIGAILSPIGWLGLLACFHRKRQAALTYEKSHTPAEYV